MLTDPTLRSQVDQLWDMLWTGGLTNPMDAIEQFSYLLFFKRLDDEENRRERQAIMRGQPFTPRVPAEMRWGHWRHFQAEKALALARMGRVGACEVSLDHSLAAARTAGDRRRASSVLAIAPVAALWGPSPVTRASGRCLDVVRVLRITQGAPAVEAVALGCQGLLEAPYSSQKGESHPRDWMAAA